MIARPWYGFMRGLRMLWARRRQTVRTQDSPIADIAPWQVVASERRRLLLKLICVPTLIASALMYRALPFGNSAGSMNLLAALQLGLFAVLFAWVSAGFWSALMGFMVSLRGDPHGLRASDLPDRPLESGARTAIVMPICNEHVATVFAGLRATCESLAATGSSGLFDVYVLSDTRDEALCTEEFLAWAQLRETLSDAAGSDTAGRQQPDVRIFYRVRKRRRKRKAGNLADFCRRWGRNYRYMIVLDADSIMSGDSLVKLVRLMEAHPRAGIIQTVPRACGHGTLHARAQQFASCITGPLFTAGMQYWQLGESHYWGHNAILRVEPFMRHCGLNRLPGRGPLSGEILSHDFVEAALMRRAGYEVWIAQDVNGSYEQLPPNLIAELERDRRWCQGNLLNLRLIAEPGITPAHRAMLFIGAMAYVSAPLWCAYLLAGTAFWMFIDPSQFATAPHEPALLGVLWCWTAIMLLLPRALGVVALMKRGEQAQFGGALRLCLSAVLEAGLSVLKAPIRMFSHSSFVFAALTGMRIEWQSPPREAHSVSYLDAARWLLGHTLVTVEWFVLAALANVWALVWLLPVYLPLLFALPITVLTGNLRSGDYLRRKALLLIPEETRPPALLCNAWEHARRCVTTPPLLVGHRLERFIEAASIHSLFAQAAVVRQD